MYDCLANVDEFCDTTEREGGRFDEIYQATARISCALSARRLWRNCIAVSRTTFFTKYGVEFKTTKKPRISPSSTPRSFRHTGENPARSAVRSEPTVYIRFILTSFISVRYCIPPIFGINSIVNSKAGGVINAPSRRRDSAATVNCGCGSRLNFSSLSPDGDQSAGVSLTDQ